MFILYAIPIGIAVGFMLRGKLDRLGDLHLRWVPLALLGIAVQLALFTNPIGAAVGDLVPLIYVASTVAVLVAVVRNIAVPGMALIAVGAGSNLAAILANGGYMPADPTAFARGFEVTPDYANSVLVADPALRPLTDIFVLPPPIPMANVFSIGDVLIGIGVALTIAIAMRRGERSVAALEGR